jgi:hypothetical protein
MEFYVCEGGMTTLGTRFLKMEREYREIRK